jgi:hypothetical protein
MAGDSRLSLQGTCNIEINIYVKIKVFHRGSISQAVQGFVPLFF